MRKKIGISGMGIECAIADSIETFEHALKSGKQGIIRIPEEQVRPLTVTHAGIIQNFNLKNRLSALNQLPSSLLVKAEQLSRRAPFPVQASVICALQAWQNAKLVTAAIPKERLGVIVSCDQATQRYQYEMTKQFNESPEYLSPRYILHSLETDHVGIVSELLELEGEGFSVGGASAGGNVALIKAAQLIESDIVDACIVLGCLSDLSPMALQGFYNIGAMGNKACCPFDKAHGGFIYGQGCGCVILEAEDSIKKRGHESLAEFLGGVLVLDGNSLADPSEKGEARAMSRCLEKAGITPEQIDYINTHGSSSPLGDRTELKAIQSVFGKAINHIWINATKGLTGHCLFAAGVIEAIACIVQMKHQFLHPNINLNQKIDDSFRFTPDHSIQTDLTYVMSNSFGFGGINTSILLKRVY